MQVFKGYHIEKTFESLEQLNKQWKRLQVLDRFLALKNGKINLLPVEDSPRMKIQKEKMQRVMKKAWLLLDSGEAKTKSEALKKAWKWAKSSKERKRAEIHKNQVPLL